MKIAHVVPTYLPATRYGGPIRSVHDLCRHLNALGHQTNVFTTDVDGPDTIRVKSSNPLDIDGVKVHYFPVCTPRRLYYSPQLAVALKNRIADFDIVHLHSTFLYPTMTAARCAEKMRIPYVISPRGMLVKDLIRKKSFLLKRAWISMFERHTVEHASAVHVTSPLESEEIRKFDFAMPPIHTIANGIDIPNVNEWAPRGTNSVLFLGRIDWKKGIERLISALSLLEDAQLIVAGNDETGYTSKLVKLCRKLGVEGRVRFVGPVTGDDKWRLYQIASVFVLPSLSENLANTVLEAMAMGCPIVVTPQVGLADMVNRHRTGLVSAGEPTALAEAIRSILNDADAARLMGEKGRRLVENAYSWQDVAAAMEQVYAEILDRKKREVLA